MTDHERVTVEILGAQLDGAAIGRCDEKLVLVPAVDACGQCDVCRRGGATVCPSARARAEVVPGASIEMSSRWLVPLGDGLELPVPYGAAVAGEVATAYTLYARTGLAPRDPVVVVGASAVTRFLVEILIGKGITPTVLADASHATWISWLGERGAQVAQSLGEIGERIAAQGNGARPWRVIATTPASAAIGATLCGPRATLTVLAPAPFALDLGAALAREVTIIGVTTAHPDLIVEAAAMVARGEVRLLDGVELGTATDATLALVLTS